MIQIFAALGLAQANDKESIPLIIEVCDSESAGTTAQIAKSLVFFDDPRAQAAADRYIPKDMLKLYREGRAAGDTPFGNRPPQPGQGAKP